MYTWKIFSHLMVSVILERGENWPCTFILVCLSWYIFRRSRAMRRLTIGPRSARPRNKSPLWESMESNMGTGLVLCLFGTVLVSSRCLKDQADCLGLVFDKCFSLMGLVTPQAHTLHTPPPHNKSLPLSPRNASTIHFPPCSSLRGEMKIV